MSKDINEVETVKVSAILDKDGDVIEDFNRSKSKDRIHIEFNSNNSFLGKIISVLILALTLFLIFGVITIVVPILIIGILVVFLLGKITKIFNKK